ncbi:MAG: hypothetical protein HYV76_01960 [Candidatus Vogelbacteria bacterium]|nr:hypothetical protein [Candidatus Vogelbacteria bacterium]
MAAAFEWQAYEYDYYDKTSDWFWLIGAGGLIGVVLAIFFVNYLLAIILLLSTGMLLFYGGREPELVEISIDGKGIRVRHELYLYKRLKSFWILEREDGPQLIVHSERLLIPHISIPLGEAPSTEIRAYLKRFLTEIEYTPTFTDHFTDWLRV